MTSSFTDAEVVTKNCNSYAKRHSKAIDVLRKANGKNDYKKIAIQLKLHSTVVSSLLKEAANLGLATKNKGLYKKNTGILKYMPKGNPKNKSLESIGTIVEKMKKRTPKFGLSEQNTDEVKMAKAYIELYRTENTLRNVIRNAFQSEQNWWENKVNKEIKNVVADAKVNYPYHGAVRKDNLEYAHLGQLNEIIVSNWGKFTDILKEKDKSNFSATVRKAIPSRNSIAHCTPLTTKDHKVVEIRFEDILKMIK